MSPRQGQEPTEARRVQKVASREEYRGWAVLRPDRQHVDVAVARADGQALVPLTEDVDRLVVEYKNFGFSIRAPVDGSIRHRTPSKLP
jgi:hypothetical protein